MKKIISLLFTLVLLAGVVFFGSQYVMSSQNKINIDSTTLKEILEPAGELVTSKYFYTNADTLSKERTQTLFGKSIKIPFSRDAYIYKYSGTIRVGIDVNEVDFDIDKENQKIVVKLPEAKIISHELSKDVEIEQVSNSLITELKMDEFQEFQNEVMTKQENQLLENTEYWQEIKKNTEDLITGLLTPICEGFTIEYEWAK